MAAAVIPHGDPAPVLDAIEHDLDLVTLFIDGFAVTQPVLPVLARRDAGGDTPFFQRRPEPVGAIAAVGDQLLCFRQALQKGSCARLC